MIINDPKHSAGYVNKKLNLHVIYLDKKEVADLNVDDSVPVPGCLLVHHVERVTENLIDPCKNLNYKKYYEIVKSTEIKDNQEQFSTVSTETTQDVLDNNLHVRLALLLLFNIKLANQI